MTHLAPLAGYGLESGLVGGKGAALDRLIGAGFTVPRSFVVTTEAYRAFVAQPEVAALLDELVGQAVDIGAATDVARNAVDGCFLTAPMPQAVRTALHDVLGGPSMGGPWAVRSSATAEDLGEASFAGQYESYLDVDTEGLERAVRLVWASAWYPAPRAYRRFMGVDDQDLAMAVVVMEMLTPSHAGVAFTADPLGSGDLMRIEIVEGLAEKLVSGDATPAVRLIDRTEPAFAPDDPPFLPALVDVALRAELAMGGPQDIEWAVERDRVFLVQARPITTSRATNPTDDGFDVRGAPDATLTTAGVAEMVPGHLCPRLWSLNQPLLEEGFRRLFASLGAADPVLADPSSPLVVRVQGRAVLDLDTMKRAVGSIPGGSAEELEHQYFGDEDTPHARPLPPPSHVAAMRQGIRTLRARTTAAIESEITIQTVDRILPRNRISPSSMTRNCWRCGCGSSTSQDARWQPRWPSRPWPPRATEASRASWPITCRSSIPARRLSSSRQPRRSTTMAAPLWTSRRCASSPTPTRPSSGQRPNPTGPPPDNSWRPAPRDASGSPTSKLHWNEAARRRCSVARPGERSPSWPGWQRSIPTCPTPTPCNAPQPQNASRRCSHATRPGASNVRSAGSSSTSAGTSFVAKLTRLRHFSPDASGRKRPCCASVGWCGASIGSSVDASSPPDASTRSTSRS